MHLFILELASLDLILNYRHIEGLGSINVLKRRICGDSGEVIDYLNIQSILKKNLVHARKEGYHLLYRKDFFCVLRNSCPNTLLWVSILP